MAFTIKLLNKKKRPNSTKQPTSSELNSAASFNCELKDATSLFTPTFLLEISSNPVGYNYAYIAEFGRYYFIKDIVSDHNLWQISCVCDVMATYKSTIGAGSHYVLRAAAEYDEDISDDFYPCNTNVASYVNYAIQDQTHHGDPLDWDLGHCYVLGIVGYRDTIVNQFGSLNYYVLDDLALKSFLQYLSDNIDYWGQIAQTEYSDGVQKALINPIQYIKSCMCMPFPASAVTASATYIRFGYYNWGDSTHPTSGTIKVISQSDVVKVKETAFINVPQHPQAADRGAYLNCQPYTRHTLHFGPWGNIDLDPMIIKDNNELKLETVYDLVTGIGRLIVTGNVTTADVLYNGTAKVGVDVNLSQIYKDALGYESATTGMIWGGLSSALQGDLIGVLANGTSGVQNMTRLNYPTVQSMGSSGSYLSMFDSENLYLLSKFNEVVDENIDEMGRPLCAVRQISTLAAAGGATPNSGYIVCKDAECPITGTRDEQQAINNYLNSGFYYE